MNTEKATIENGNLPIFSVRRSALGWWNKLPMYNMDKPCKRVLSNLHYSREPNSLTGREIQVIYERHYA